MCRVAFTVTTYGGPFGVVDMPVRSTVIGPPGGNIRLDAIREVNSLKTPLFGALSFSGEPEGTTSDKGPQEEFLTTLTILIRFYHSFPPGGPHWGGCRGGAEQQQLRGAAWHRP
jgi:hypothetical protein